MRILAILGLLLLLDTASSGEVYRCTQEGRTVFSDRPCPGAQRVDGLPTDARRGVAAAPARDADASGTTARVPQFDAQATGQDPTIERNMAELGHRCAAGDAGACQIHRLNRSHYAENQQRNERCAAGETRACDEIRCLAENDRAACARVD